MGAGNFSMTDWDKFKNDHQIDSRSAAETFNKSADPKFDPRKIGLRESCESKDKPNVTPIIIALDVTGSMGVIPEALIKGGLGNLMKNLLAKKSIPNPHIMFMAVGDVNCDRAPLQVTQFEADVRIAEQLKNLYLEGGGGGNGSESYPIAWHFAASRTALDSFNKREEKGMLFTIGDDYAPEKISGYHLDKFLGEENSRDLTTREMLKMAQDKFEVFHLGIQQSSTYTTDVKRSWTSLLGERHIAVADYTQIDKTIVETIDAIVGQRNRINASARSLNRLSLMAAPRDESQPPAYEPPSPTSSYRMNMT
jgi:hypothetical protein